MVNHEALKTLAFVFFYFFMLFALLDTGIFYENDVKFQETHFWMQGPDTWRSTIKTVYLVRVLDFFRVCNFIKSTFLT
ncbi:hypothetical protein CRE_02457 [Caenorhabditis remanei]|uniref:Uncharacterized protein n=1 Tax=Caenorhabditis remanei TaxID=31234 RepID=E3MIV4_CAERE|nr:hypothetical protein CRE_02457 [Caenorhabditis remanei]